MKYSAEELSKAVDKYRGKSYSKMDCQAFVEKCMEDVGFKRNLPGSNAWFRAMDWTGTPEECVRVFGQVPKGAFLYILKNDGKEPEKYKPDGIGNASHIGIKTGRGKGAINSSSSRGCVCESDFADKSIRGGWNRVGLLKAFDYGKSINWLLDHSGAAPADPGGEVSPMQGRVVAESGKTVKLRQKPSTSCAVYWDVPVGTELEVLEQQETWSRCVTGGLVGWMMNQFVEIIDPLTGGKEEPVNTGPDPGERITVSLSYAQAAAVLPVLKAIAGEIEAKVGRAVG